MLFSQISNWGHQVLCWHVSIPLDLHSQEFSIIDKASSSLRTQGKADEQHPVISATFNRGTFWVWAADSWKSPALTASLTALLFNWLTNTSTSLLRQTYQFAIDFLRQKDRVLLQFKLLQSLSSLHLYYIDCCLNRTSISKELEAVRKEMKKYSFKFFLVFGWTIKFIFF